ncbi:MAG TPA: glycosyltransferase family 39 protein [Acidobacteriaceae bacterium]|nr:glycosyltransferase family 39 protein [Acidobacteriaceae bacterium]
MSVEDSRADSRALPQFPWTIFWTALAIRIAAMTLGHFYRIAPFEDHFKFGWEMGRIARSLAIGHGYANPFDHPSGPTAWVTPLYPLILAGVFRIFGVYTALSAWVILAFNCVCSALTAWTTWEITSRCFNRRVALWSAWIWALYPAAMQFAVKWIWEISLTTFLFSCILVLALRMRNVGGPADPDPATTRRWALFGLIGGLITLSSASIAIFLPFCGIWILRGAGSLRRQIPRVALAAALCVACIVPWIVRNAYAFHAFVPMRTNFGAEFWMGNNPNLQGMVIGSPVALESQEALLDRMGELAYSKSRGRLAIAEIRADRPEFLRLTLRRFYFFWADVPHASLKGKGWTEYVRGLNFQFTSVVGILGLALAIRRKIPGAWLFAMAFVAIPFVYYFVFVQARFRHPLEPLIAILAVYLFQSAEKSWQIRWLRR